MAPPQRSYASAPERQLSIARDALDVRHTSCYPRPRRVTMNIPVHCTKYFRE
jgi:hypothetical protein